MAVYINDTVNENTDCETPIPKVCGRQNVHMPTASCDTIHFTGVDDAEINQGQDFDPTEGVHAYDGNGEEIPFTVEPSEVDECQVGEIELEYTATGVGKKLLPKLCGSPNLKLPYCGVERKRLKRNLVIKGIAPPSIRGIERVCLDRETLFNPMDGVSAVDGNGNTLEVSHSGTYDEVASGEIASFESIGGKSKSLKVALEPIQDLHGYDKPWSGGAGKNKFDVDAWIALDRNSNFYSVSNDVVSVIANDASGLAGRLIQLAPNTEYTISFTNASSCRVFDDTAETLAQTSSQTSATFTTTASGQIAVKFYGSTYPTVIGKVQIEAGSTATAWTPYSNIAPISGHTEVDTHRTGVNVWDEEWEVGTYDIGTGEKRNAPNYWRSKNMISVKPSQTYYFLTSGDSIWRFMYDADKQYIGYLDGINNAVWQVPNNVHYINIVNVTRNAYDPTAKPTSINYPSTDHEYHAYQGDTYHTELGQTVYGGTLDIVSGELVVDRATADLGTLGFSYDPSGKRWQVAMSDIYNYPSRNGNLVAEKYVADITASAGDEGKMFTVGKALYIYSTDGVTPPSGNLVYPLAAPQTIQLTPQEVTLLVGNNNVWSDGMVTVAYPTNIPDGAYNYPFDGAYEITYHAEDRCGNETTEVRQVIVSKSNSVCGARVCCATVAC